MEKEKSIGGLWVREAQNGKKYITGKVGDMNIVCFVNEYKKESKHPDYVIYKSKPRERFNDNQTTPAKDNFPNFDDAPNY